PATRAGARLAGQGRPALLAGTGPAYHGRRRTHGGERAGMRKYVYDFVEGNKDLKDLLGGKGANLAEMTRMGLPVPPGFTISTEACRAYLRTGELPDGLLA